MAKTKAVALGISPNWRRRAVLALSSFALIGLPMAGRAASSPIEIKANDQTIQITVSNSPALSYHLQKPKNSTNSSPSAAYFHPLTTPSGLVVTDVAPDDHPHHRGVFLAWLEVTGESGTGDFWGWGQYVPIKDRLIVHRKSAPMAATRHSASFSARNEWLAETVPLLEETLRATVTFNSNARIHDLAFEFRAKEQIVLGRHAFSGFSVRMRKDHPLTAYDPSGTVSLPAPSHLKPESDWPDRPWYAFEMSLPEGKKAGVAVLSHPGNPPTLWHNVTGIALINPCVIARGPVRISSRQPLPLRYQVVTFDGPTPAALLDRLAGEFARVPVRSRGTEN